MNMNAEAAKLPARDKEWAAAASDGGDVDKILSYWAEDAVVIAPGQPLVEGKAAIRRFVTDSLQIPGFKIHWSSEGATLSPDGKLGYIRAANTTNLTGPDGKMITLQGRAVTVWRVDSDGVWRCVVDIWNDAPR